MSSRADILAALEAGGARGDGGEAYVSGAQLAEDLGISRAAVWKHIGALKRDGYEIEGARARGYRLVAAPSRLAESAIRARLRGERIGRRVVLLDVTRSTNADAMVLGREGEPEGTAVLAEQQTAGRGRLGRSWESTRGVNLYMSLLLRPRIPPARAPQLSLLAGVAVADTAREAGIDAGIKWPNDVVTTGPGGALRKLAGVLTEIEAEADRVAFVVVGIGVNVNADRSHFSAEIADRATSLLIEGGRRQDRAAFAGRLLSRIGDLYEAWEQQGLAAITPRWRELSVLDGRDLRVEAPGEVYEGRCAGLDDDGALLLDTGGGGRRRVLAGDVTISGGYDPCQR